MKILTLAIGEDFRNKLHKALQSKRDYCNKNGYEFIMGNEQFWDRNRPIAWSKVPFLLSVLEQCKENEILFLSDADVYITNMNLRIEEHILPLLLENKDLLMTIDSCGNINDGNIIMRNTPWLRDFWKRVYDQTDLIYHIWWENAAVIRLLEENKNDLEKIQITSKYKLFNAYIQGIPGAPLWEPGDFLVHFAGIYDPLQIAEYINDIDNGQIPRKNIF
jgi:hypothetical protein